MLSEDEPSKEDLENALENLDESLANLEQAGLITWDRGAGLIHLTELGKQVGGLLPKEWEVKS